MAAGKYDEVDVTDSETGVYTYVDGCVDEDEADATDVDGCGLCFDMAASMASSSRKGS